MAITPLLPERHPTRDFFIADVFDSLPVKDDMASMESPFFTLSTKPDHRHLQYQYGDTSVSVIPSGLGLPSIYDKDLLLYCASHVMEKLNNGETPPKTLRIAPHDYFVATNRPAGGDAYGRFKASLVRLRGCTVTTTIETGGSKQTEGFGLIERFKYLESHRVKDRFVGLEITLSDWFYNSLIAREVLTISRDYFRLRKPIERRVYEIARKHCGSQAEWSISLERLYVKSGSVSPLKRFRAAIKDLAAQNHLPDYSLSYSRADDRVRFRRRASALLGETTSGVPENIPPKILEDARAALGTGIDFYPLWAEFSSWKGSLEAKSWSAAFIGFCRGKLGNTGAGLTSPN